MRVALESFTARLTKKLYIYFFDERERSIVRDFGDGRSTGCWLLWYIAKNEGVCLASMHGPPLHIYELPGPMRACVLSIQKLSVFSIPQAIWPYSSVIPSCNLLDLTLLTVSKLCQHGYTDSRMINKERTREIKSNDGDLCVARRYVQVFCRVSEKKC